MKDDEVKLHPDKPHNEWWDEFEDIEYRTVNYEEGGDNVSLESYCLTCWWHNFDDEKSSNGRVHKAEFPKHVVKSKAGLEIYWGANTDDGLI